MMKKNILLLTISLLLICGALELALQILHTPQHKWQGPRDNWVAVPEKTWVEKHPFLGWVNQKNKAAVLQKDGWSVPISTNAQGFRGKKDYVPKKNPPVKRVVILGDSFPFGWGVRDNETFSALLESSDPHLEAPNLGVAGYGLDQILLSYRLFGKALEPDVVLIHIFPEDFWRSTRSFTDGGYIKPYFSINPDNKLTLNHSPIPKMVHPDMPQFPDIVRYTKTQQLLRKSLLYQFITKLTSRLMKNLDLIDPDSTLEWILGQRILNQLVSEIEMSKARPVIVIVPPARWVSREERWTSLRKSIHRFGHRENIDVIDLTPHLYQAVQQTTLTDYYIKDDYHWTQKGHHLVKDVLAAYLSELNYMTPSAMPSHATSYVN